MIKLIDLLGKLITEECQDVKIILNKNGLEFVCDFDGMKDLENVPYTFEVNSISVFRETILIEVKEG